MAQLVHEFVSSAVRRFGDRPDAQGKILKRELRAREQRAEIAATAQGRS